MTFSAQQLDEMVVSAFEGKRKLIETPASIARITAIDMERFDLRSPQQAFSTLPSVKIESTTIGRYRVRIRGGSLGLVGHSDSYKMYWNVVVKSEPWTDKELKEFRKLMEKQKSELGEEKRSNIKENYRKVSKQPA